MERTEDQLISVQPGTIHGLRGNEDGGEVAVRVGGKVVRFTVEHIRGLQVGDPVVVRLYNTVVTEWSDVIVVSTP